MKSFFVPLVFLSLLASCTTYRLQSVSQPPAEPDGLSVQASALWAPDIQFDVKVANKSSKSITVDSNRFRLYVGEPDSWHEIPLIPSDEYYRQAEYAEQNRPGFTVTSTDAPVYRRRTTTTVIGNGNGSSVVITRNEPPVVEQNTRTVTYVPRVNQQRLDWLKSHLFYSVTLEPGKDYQGLVYGSIGRGTHYKLVVSVDGKNYEAVFQRVKDTGNSPFTNLN